MLAGAAVFNSQDRKAISVLSDNQAGAEETNFSRMRKHCAPGFSAGAGRANEYSKSEKKQIGIEDVCRLAPAGITYVSCQREMC